MPDESTATLAPPAPADGTTDAPVSPPLAAPDPNRKPYLSIRPSSPWKLVDITELFHFRDLMFSLAGRDLKLRYKQTILGVIWVVLQPLLAAGIFSFVFGNLASFPSDGVPYFVFSYAGLLAWNLFSSTLTKSSTCLVGNANLVSKVYFPRMILPLSTVPSTLVDFSVSTAVMAVLLITAGVTPGWGLLLLPVWMLLLLFLALGIGMIAGSMAVSYRDVQYILPVFTQMLLYASPIAYPLSVVHHKFQHHPEYYTLYCVNPMTGLLAAFRWSVLGKGHLHAGPVLWSATCAVLLIVIGAMTFRRMERRFADVI